MVVRGRAALWSPADGGSGGPGKPAEAHGYRRGAVGRLGGAVGDMGSRHGPEQNPDKKTKWISALIRYQKN